MNNVFSLMAKIGLDSSSFESGINKVKNGLNEVKGKFSEGVKSSDSFRNALDKMSKAGETLTTLGEKLTPLSLAMAGIDTLSVNTAASFEDAMLKVQSLTGATGDEYEQLTQKALELGSSTRWSASEVGESMQYLALSGMDAGDIVANVGDMLNLASASGEGLGTVTDILTDSMTAFGDSADQAGRYADVLAQTQASSNTTVGALGEAFKYAAPLAGSMGYELEDVSTALGTMANAGVKGSMAGTSLSTILTRLSTNAGATKNSMGALDTLQEKLGVSFYNADGTARNLSDVMKDLSDATKDLSVEEKAEVAKKIAGQEAMKGLLAIMNQGSDAYADLEGKVKNSNGAAENMAETMESGLGGSIRSMKSAIEGASIALGTSLAPIISKVAGKITELANWFSSLDPKIQSTIAIVTLLVAGLAPALVVIGTIISSTSAILGLLGGLSLTFVPVVAGIAAIVAVGILLYKSWDDIVVKGQEIKAKLGVLWATIKTTATNNINQMKTGIISAFNKLKTTAASVWNGIKTAIINPVKNAKTTATTTFDNLKNSASEIWDKCKNLAKSAFDGVKKNIIDPVVNAKNTAVETFSTLKSNVTDKVESIKSKVGTTFEEIKSKITKPISDAKTTVKKMLDTVKGYFPLKVGKIFSGIKIPTINVDKGEAPYEIGGKGRKPSVSITWNRKAVDSPYMFTGATLFGAGETKDEILYGRENLMKDIRQASAGNSIDYTALGNAVVTAIVKADLSFKVGNREFARLVKKAVTS